MESDMAVCRQCGERHLLESMELAFFRPDAVVDLSDDERTRDVQESNDLCVIRNEHYFVRATLPLPVRESERPYRLGVWIETNEADFRRIHDLWSDDLQASEPPFEVTIANTIPTVPETRGLAAKLRLTGPRTRPEIFIMTGDHPIADQQRDGITAHRAYEYTASTQR